MENSNDKRIDDWFVAIGPERFMVINTLIDDTVDQVQKITPNDELLATLEARLLELAAHIITSEDFMIDIRNEYEYCGIQKIDSAKIDELLQTVIKDPLLQQNTAADISLSGIKSSTAPSPSDILARMNQVMVKPTTIVSTKREYGSIAPSQTSGAIGQALSRPLSQSLPLKSTTPDQAAPQHIDPYRELPDTK